MLNALRDEMGFGSSLKGEALMSRHIPYTRHVADSVLRLQNGALMSVIKLNGLFFQTEDQAEINLRSAVQNTLIRALGSSRFSVWSTVVRREVKPSLPSDFDDPFCRELDERYQARLAQKRMFTNDIFLTIVRSDLKGALGLSDQVKRLWDRSNGNAVTTQQLRESASDLEEHVVNIAGGLAKYGARVLGIVRRDGDPYSEPCEFLELILSGGVSRQMRLPRMAINSYVGSARLHFGKRAMQVQAAAEADDRFGAMLSIKEYPPFTGPGMLDGLLQLPHEFILTQSFSISDKPIAQERITRLKRQIAASDEAGSAVEDNIDRALNQLANQEAVFGVHHLSLLAIARSNEKLGKVVSDLGASLTDMNINWVREDLNLEAAFWAQLPGNHGYVARGAMLSSSNFTGLSSMHNFAQGREQAPHWNLPISILETTSQTPYWFNFHQRDIGHFLVTGPTGSGKTVAMTFLLAQSFRVSPRPRAVFFDKDRGAEIFIRAMGGSYEVLTPGTPTGFNPLQLPENAENRDFLNRLIKVMVGGELSLSQSDNDLIEQGISQTMQQGLERRNLATLAALMAGRNRADSNDLAARLRPWFDGDKAWLFNAPTDALSLGGTRCFGFDMTNILSNTEVRTPALMYIYHRLDELLNGEPVMFFMDEGWQLLSDPTFSHFIMDKMKTIRKLNGIVGFGTQSAADIAKSSVSHTLIEQSSTNIHFPNPRADEESYMKRFGLTAKEFGFIKTTAPESRTFLIKHGNDSVIAKLDLSTMPEMVKVLSGRRETIAECEALRKEHGNDPADWLELFMKGSN